MPHRKFESLEVINARMENIEEVEKTKGKGWATLLYNTLKNRKECLESGKELETHMNLNQVIFRFNSVVLVPFQFETS